MPTPDPQELAWYPTNDLGNAERLQALSRGLLRWVDQGDDQGYWIAFADTRWSRRDGMRRARLLTDEVARHLREEAKALAQQISDRKIGDVPEDIAKERLTELRKWSLKSGNSSQSDGMLKKAKPLLTISDKEFDPDKLAFNVANGTVRFVPPEGPSAAWSVTLSPHNPEDMITRVADVVFDPGAACPKWLARLDQLQPEADQRGMMQRIFGYAVQGIRSEQVFITAQGKGGDGKSLTHTVISKIFGEYYRHSDVQSFLKGGQRSGSDHSEDLARLAGDTRFVTADEPERFSTWNSKILKQATGGGKMTVRDMRAKSEEIDPRFLLLVECNTFPKVPTSDEGFWRRTVVFQWPVQLSRDQQGDFEGIVAELLEERSGILNWMIEGALLWLAERTLKPSARAEEVKENYRNTSDPFAEWYRTRTVTGSSDDPALREKGADLHADFKWFCEEELGVDGAKVPGLRAFGTQLDERQHPNRKTMGNKWRFGIRLKSKGELAAEGASASPVDDGGNTMPEGFD